MLELVFSAFFQSDWLIDFIDLQKVLYNLILERHGLQYYTVIWFTITIT